MKTLFQFLSLMISVALLGCGSGGGGGGGGNTPTTNGVNPYVVSTLNLGAGTPLTSPNGIAIDSSGNLFVTDTGVNLVKKVTNLSASPATVTTVLGGGATDYSFCTSSLLDAPYGIAINSSSNLFVAEANKALIRYADCTSSPTVSAQYGSTVGFDLSNARGVALLGSNLYVADTGNNLIRVIANQGGSNGTTTTLAGTSAGYVNGANGLSAFSGPTGLAVTPSGTIYVADTQNCAIRKIVSGQVTTFAGALPGSNGAGTCGNFDGTGTAALFNHPTGIALDSNNNLYVADSLNHKIRRIGTDGVVTTLAGTGSSGASDGNASNATFNGPTGIAIDSSGNLFVVDSGNKKIRKITLTP